MVSVFHFRPRLYTLDFNNLPNWLKQNHFIQAVYEPSSTITVDTGVQEIIGHLPEGFELINLGVKGKQAKISITYGISSISRPTLFNHRIPSIPNIPISDRYENELKKDFGSLLVIDMIF